MPRYSHEPVNATKSCKARGSNLRVHFKVSVFYDESNLKCDLLEIIYDVYESNRFFLYVTEHS